MQVERMVITVISENLRLLLSGEHVRELINSSRKLHENRYKASTAYIYAVKMTRAADLSK